MKEVVLDESLEIVEREFPEFNHKYFFEKIDDFTPIEDYKSGVITHRNYLDYLTLCWRRHYGIIISPTILWNLMLNNLAYKVNEEPEVFRQYFTESEDKQEIMVVQGGNRIDVDLIISKIESYIPTNIMGHVFPNFTTNTEESKIANYTAFLDMVSPYYNYSMFLCGIPKVKILGNKEDWMIYYNKCNRIAEIIPEFKEYLNDLQIHIMAIIEETANFSEFFYLKKCGSGSQEEVSGWIRDFFIIQPRLSYPENFIPCISKIDYHCYNDKKDYRLYAGLFTSVIEDDYLIPFFDKMYFEKIKE